MVHTRARARTTGFIPTASRVSALISEYALPAQRTKLHAPGLIVLVGAGRCSQCLALQPIIRPDHGATAQHSNLCLMRSCATRARASNLDTTVHASRSVLCPIASLAGVRANKRAFSIKHAT